VIMITAYGDIYLAVRALKEGAADFVVKPWHNEKLTDTIREALLQKAKSNSVKNTATDFSAVFFSTMVTSFPCTLGTSGVVGRAVALL